MDQSLLLESLSADEFDASNMLEDDRLFCWFDTGDFEELVGTVNERLADRKIEYEDIAPPGEWATPRFTCEGRSASFETNISSEDLHNGLLCIDEVIGEDYQIYLATETLSDSQVAVCILPRKLATEVSGKNSAFCERLIRSSADRNPFEAA